MNIFWALRPPPQHTSHVTFMQPLHQDFHPHVAENPGGTEYASQQAHPQPPNTRVAFIPSCSYFTQENTWFRVPASSPTRVPCKSHAAILVLCDVLWCEVWFCCTKSFNFGDCFPMLSSLMNVVHLNWKGALVTAMVQNYRNFAKPHRTKFDRLWTYLAVAVVVCGPFRLSHFGMSHRRRCCGGGQNGLAEILASTKGTGNWWRRHVASQYTIQNLSLSYWFILVMSVHEHQIFWFERSIAVSCRIVSYRIILDLRFLGFPRSFSMGGSVQSILRQLWYSQTHLNHVIFETFPNSCCIFWGS